jgi:xylulokinase
MYVTYAFTFTSGSVLKWYRDQWGQNEVAEAARLGVNAYDLLIERALAVPNEPRSSSLFILPHFAGAATPYMDPASLGAIVGLTINTPPEAIVKAILEGMTYEIMVNVERLAQAGIEVDDLVTVGGLAKSEPFLQLKATMMGKKVTTLHVSEAGTLGVAILAGTASGVYRSLEDGVKQLVRKKKVYYPDERLHEQYLEQFEIYKRLYPAVKQIYRST